MNRYSQYSTGYSYIMSECKLLCSSGCPWKQNAFRICQNAVWQRISFFAVFVSSAAALASLGYEKTCVLFNAAALASQIASEQNLDNDEGLKAAAKYYQVGMLPRSSVPTVTCTVWFYYHLKSQLFYFRFLLKENHATNSPVSYT